MTLSATAVPRGTIQTRRRAVIVLVALLAAGNLLNAMRKGGDFDVLVEAGRRVAAGAPLYAGSLPGTGITWPPFEGVFILPFALVPHPILAKLAWHAVSVVALLLALAWSAAALGRDPSPAAGGDGRWRGSLAPALVPLLAILLPLQTNFQHQNLNTVLLALVTAAILYLRRGREVAGGALVGVATALKAFPGLLIVALVAQRAWLAAASAIVVTTAATLSPVLFYGPGEGVRLPGTWLAFNQHGGWPIENTNQSLFAVVYRWFGRPGTPGNGHVYAAPDSLPYWIAAGTVVVLVGALIAVVARARSSSTPPAADARPAHLAAALALAVVISPIAWDHYWVLMFPALYVLHDRAHARWHRVMFCVCALLISGLSRVTIGASGLALARDMSAWTIAGVLLVVAVLVVADCTGGERSSLAGTEMPTRRAR